MSAKDAKRELEIEAMVDFQTLRKLRSSCKGQLTKLEKYLEHYRDQPLGELKRPTLECMLTNLDKQHYFYMLIQDHLLHVMHDDTAKELTEEEEKEEQEREAQHFSALNKDSPSSKRDMPIFEGEPKLWRKFWERFTQRLSMDPDLPASEKIAQLEQAIKPADGRALIRAVRERLLDMINALDVLVKVKRLRKRLEAFQKSDSLADIDMLDKLQKMDPVIDELMESEASLPEIEDLSRQIQVVHLLYRKHTKEAIRS